MTLNPYNTNPESMRSQLEDPSVNWREHHIYAPRFMAMLPRGRFGDDGINRVLDFGCGAGNFTAQLAARYKNAYVVGADAATDIFDTARFGTDVNFIPWDGQSDIDFPLFDLIVSKMAFHYLNPIELDRALRNLVSALAAHGELAISAPFDGFYMGDQPKQFATPVIREVGTTGMQASMYDYTILAAMVGSYLPDNYGYAVDNVKDENGTDKRVNMLFYPMDKFRRVKRRLVKAGVSNGDYDKEMAVFFSDAIRTVGVYATNVALAEWTAKNPPV